jgi:hypothetical protein
MSHQKVPTYIESSLVLEVSNGKFQKYLLINLIRHSLIVDCWLIEIETWMVPVTGSYFTVINFNFG